MNKIMRYSFDLNISSSFVNVFRGFSAKKSKFSGLSFGKIAKYNGFKWLKVLLTYQPYYFSFRFL